MSSPVTPSRRVRPAPSRFTCTHAMPTGARRCRLARECDAAVAAIRSAAPDLPIGLSTAEAIDPDPLRGGCHLALADAARFHLGQPSRGRVAGADPGRAPRRNRHRGGACNARGRTGVRRQRIRAPGLRALVEVAGGAEEARQVAALVPDGVPQLWPAVTSSPGRFSRRGLPPDMMCGSGWRTCWCCPTDGQQRTTPNWSNAAVQLNAGAALTAQASGRSGADALDGEGDVVVAGPQRRDRQIAVNRPARFRGAREAALNRE